MGALFNSCTKAKHLNESAVGQKGIRGQNIDIDEAALQAIQNGIGDYNKAFLKQTVQLSFALRNLPNLDTFSKTDPFLILYELKKQGNRVLKQQIGRTECIYDNLNPDFVKNFDVDFLFEECQNFLVEAYDMDDSNRQNDLKAQEFIGSVEFQLHQIVTSKNQTINIPVVNPIRKNNGNLIITLEEKKLNTGGELITLKLKGQIKNNGKVFFLIWKTLSFKQYKPVYKSEIVSKNQQGYQQWNEFQIDSFILCNQDVDKEIKIDVFQSQTNGDHKFLESTVFTLAQIKNGFKLQLQGGQSIEVEKFEKKKSCNFLEYVFGGCQINLNIAIDFTASNGQPTENDSLHNQDYQKNEYLQALKAVGNILQYYDSDKEIPAYGFGAIIPPISGRPSHCFALNGDIFSPECNAIQGVEAVYKNTLNQVKLYGPTYFAEIISTINGRCESCEVSNYNQQYQILLILTDGVINDIQNTIDEVVRGSDLPLSIVIVGVGNADFSQMDVLDADSEPLFSKKYNRFMSRDIVQFVPFRQFRNDPFKLAKETLQEIPGQLVDFFQKKNIFPKPAKEEDRLKILSQLSLKSKIDPNKQLDLYQTQLKEKLINQCNSMNMDPFQIQDFLEEKGLWENQINTLLDLINNQNFFNVLKIPEPIAPYGQQFLMDPQSQPVMGHAVYHSVNQAQNQQINQNFGSIQQQFGYNTAQAQNQHNFQQYEYFDPNQK